MKYILCNVKIYSIKSVFTFPFFLFRLNLFQNHKISFQLFAHRNIYLTIATT